MLHSTKKITKLREINSQLNKRLCVLETYIFINNIMPANIIDSKKINSDKPNKIK